MIKRRLLAFLTVIATLTVGCGKTQNSEEKSNQSQQQTSTSEQIQTKPSIFSRPVVEKVQGQRKNWEDVSSFICYYGDFDDEQKELLVVIVELYQ